MRLLREGGLRALPGSLRDPPCWESRRVCLVFPGEFSLCSQYSPEVLPPGPVVIPMFGTAMSGLGQGGNGSGSLSLSLGKPWIGVPPGCWGAAARASAVVFLRGGCTGMLGCSQVLILSLFSLHALHPRDAPEGSHRFCRGREGVPSQTLAPGEAEWMQTGNEGSWALVENRVSGR